MQKRSSAGRGCGSFRSEADATGNRVSAGSQACTAKSCDGCGLAGSWPYAGTSVRKLLGARRGSAMRCPAASARQRLAPPHVNFRDGAISAVAEYTAANVMGWMFSMARAFLLGARCSRGSMHSERTRNRLAVRDAAACSADRPSMTGSVAARSSAFRRCARRRCGNKGDMLRRKGVRHTGVAGPRNHRAVSAIHPGADRLRERFSKPRCSATRVRAGANRRATPAGCGTAAPFVATGVKRIAAARRKPCRKEAPPRRRSRTGRAGETRGISVARAR